MKNKNFELRFQKLFYFSDTVSINNKYLLRLNAKNDAGKSFFDYEFCVFSPPIIGKVLVHFNVNFQKKLK